MISIHQNTLKDLEFLEVLNLIKDHCITTLGEELVLQTVPFTNTNKITTSLNEVHEFLASFENDNVIPNHGFNAIHNQLKLLNIENSFIEAKELKDILNISITYNTLIKFFKKFKEYYPVLHNFVNTIKDTKDVIQIIDPVLDKYGQIKNSASPTLAQIRQSINSIRGQLDESFNKALAHNISQDFLDEIRETVIENKRVLAVKAMYRRKVKGSLLGSSKTGSIAYILPEATQKHTRELENLEFEEQEEITRILKQVTNNLREYYTLLNNYQNNLTYLDIVFAKAKFAKDINATLPKLNNNKELFIKDAYHPLLYLNNKKENKKTYPQTISLNKETRIIVVSGPNAGGKSITLKTIGLLQLMLQSGILIPVHERSTVCLFDRILSDIGDNQSIENHLSTYSYRLKQMNYFLKKCNDNTLFLIDEFGTGSDPELGGALAETFLEVFYQREAYGVITTHYSNLKLLANELPFMQNANMQFDQRSLEPKFHLALGQAGSSFTFEVAQKNGIPYSLINKAKKKIERGKVRFDKTIAKLQKERNKLEKTERSLKLNEQKKLAEADKLESINTRIQKKLESYQELFDANQRLIYLGQKVDTLAASYFNNKQKRTLLNELFKLVQIENSKRKKESPKQQKIKKEKQQQLKQEINKKVALIRKQKKTVKKATPKVIKPKPVLKVGDKVRLEDGRAIGTIEKIEKQKAIVNYGLFTTNVSIEQLELAQ